MELNPPSSLRKGLRNSDHVAFNVESTFKSGEKELKKFCEVCYRDYNYTSDTVSQRVCCYPLNKIIESPLPASEFKQWMDLCIKNKVVIDNSIAETFKGKNVLVFNTEADTKKVYSTFCCYRWAENLPEFSWTVLKISEQYPSIDFFQALHYASCLYVTNYGHSFLPINTSKTYISNIIIKNLCMLLSIYTKFFYVGENQEFNAKKYKSMYDATVVIKSFISNQDLLRDTERYCVKDCSEILFDKWAELYVEMPSKDKLNEKFPKI